jgi:acyl-CoA hydrolase
MRELKNLDKPMLIRILSAAGDAVVLDDGAEVVDSLQTPAFGNASFRPAMHGARYPSVDMQSSHLPEMVELGLFGNLDFAVVEAVDVVRDGRVYLSTSGGPSPSLLKALERSWINHRQSTAW